MSWHKRKSQIPAVCGMMKHLHSFRSYWTRILKTLEESNSLSNADKQLMLWLICNIFETLIVSILPVYQQMTQGPGAKKPTGNPPGPVFDTLTKQCDVTDAHIYSCSTNFLNWQILKYSCTHPF